jgi:cytochrome d ubiquinol oxidase subunit I
MSNVDLARLQFAMTSIYHFLFVPLTIGLAFLTAILQTRWHRSGNAEQLRLTRFFGVLLLINVAVGVVTGLVQEFQFGMDWSIYSRTVGDVFGAPLAMEGLAAFFLESTFLGVWVFGWGRLKPSMHLASIWLVAIGAMLSAAFIMAANSWMQHPVGYEINSSTGRPQLNNIVAVMTNPIFIRGYLHVLLASAVTGSVVMLAVSAWHLRRGRQVEVFEQSARLALVVLAPAILLAMLVGSELGVTQDKYQPMKIAASEAQWDTCQPCSFSLLQIGGGKNDHTPTKIIQIPHLLSLLATNSWNGKVLGLNEVEPVRAAVRRRQLRPTFHPVLVDAVMAYIAGIVFLLSLWGLWTLRRKRLTTSRAFLTACRLGGPVAFIMNTAGWMLTENGRQPWIVRGSCSPKRRLPSISAATVATSLIAFLILYGVLAVIDAILMSKYAQGDRRAERRRRRTRCCRYDLLR